MALIDGYDIDDDGWDLSDAPAPESTGVIDGWTGGDAWENVVDSYNAPTPTTIDYGDDEGDGGGVVSYQDPAAAAYAARMQAEAEHARREAAEQARIAEEQRLRAANTIDWGGVSAGVKGGNPYMPWFNRPEQGQGMSWAPKGTGQYSGAQLQYAGYNPYFSSLPPARQTDGKQEQQGIFDTRPYTLGQIPYADPNYGAQIMRNPTLQHGVGQEGAPSRPGQFGDWNNYWVDYGRNKIREGLQRKGSRGYSDPAWDLRATLGQADRPLWNLGELPPTISLQGGPGGGGGQWGGGYAGGYGGYGGYGGWPGYDYGPVSEAVNNWMMGLLNWRI